MYYEGHGRIQLDRVLHYAGESDFELFLYNGQVNSNKEYFSMEFTITDISFEIELHSIRIPSLALLEAFQSHNGLHRSCSLR